MSLETIDTLSETFMVLRGMNRKTVGAEAQRMGINGPWLTQSYLEMILERKAVPCLSMPSPLCNTPVTTNQGRSIASPRPIRTTTNMVTWLEELSQPWTRSPTKSQMEPVLAT